MIEIYELPYATWQKVIDDNNYSVFHIKKSDTDSDKRRIAFAGSRPQGIVWRTFVSHSDFTGTYNSKYESAGTAVISEEDAVANIIGLDLLAIPVIQEVRPNLFPDGITLVFTGVGDNGTANRMNGQRFIHSRSSTGLDTTPYEFSFCDWGVISGGWIDYTNGYFGSYIRYDVVAPATPTPPTSGGTLNCKRTDLGGGAMRIDAVTSGATHYLDLSNGSLGVPVPAMKWDDGRKRRVPDGFWDWSYPETGYGQLIHKPNQDGWYHLYEFEVSLARYVADVPCILGNGTHYFQVEALRPQIVLPHWKSRVYLNNASAVLNFQVAWVLEFGRARATP